MSKNIVHGKKKCLESIVRIFFYVFRFVGYLIHVPTYKNSVNLILSSCRAGYWSTLIKTGKGVYIYPNVTIIGNPRMIEIGDNSIIDTNVKFDVYKKLKIGKYVHICHDVQIQSGDEVIIGDHVAIAAGSKIYSASNTYKNSDDRHIRLISMSSAAPMEMQNITHAKIIIEPYAFIGLNSVVLPGITIGKGAVVGAGSVVTKNIPPFV